MPYIEDEQACINYGNWFASQIKYLKSIRPDAVFIVIGPSDMSTKIGTEYDLSVVTRKGCTEKQPCNPVQHTLICSRPWVERIPCRLTMLFDPPLAAPDYTHFHHVVARLMGEMFMRPRCLNTNIKATTVVDRLCAAGPFSSCFIRVDKCNFLHRSCTSRHTYIQYRLNRLDNPDSSYALLPDSGEQFDAICGYMATDNSTSLHFGGSHIQADIYPNVLRNTFGGLWTAAGQIFVAFLFAFGTIPITLEP